MPEATIQELVDFVDAVWVRAINRNTIPDTGKYEGLKDLVDVFRGKGCES